MVQLEEVVDEELQKEQIGPQEDENDWDTDDESDTSSVLSDADDFQESIYDRITALKDIVPPQTRRTLSSVTSKTTEYSWWTASKIASVGWILSVSALMLMAPFAIATLEEQQIQMEERERDMREKGVEGIMTPGGGAAATQATQPL